MIKNVKITVFNETCLFILFIPLFVYLFPPAKNKKKVSNQKM